MADKVLGIKVSEELYNKFQEIAERDGKTPNALGRELIVSVIDGSDEVLKPSGRSTPSFNKEEGTDESGETVLGKLPSRDRLEALMVELTRRLITEETGEQIVDGLEKLAESVKQHTDDLTKLAEILDTSAEPVSVPAILGTDNSGKGSIREKLLDACLKAIGHRIFALHKNAGLCSFGNLTANYSTDSFKNFKESYPSVGKNQELLDIYKQYVSMFARLIVIDHIVQRKPYQEKISDGSLFDGRNDGAYGTLLKELIDNKAENLGEQKFTSSIKEGV